jgi:glucose/arabinose dehydrogenase/mono/diheme cytochrome c family protein
MHPFRIGNNSYSVAAVLFVAWTALATAIGAYPGAHAAEPTESSACPGDDSGLKLPAGFCATIFADDIGHARHLVVGSNGVVYVNTWSGVYFGNDVPHAGGFLVALKDTTGDGKANVNQRFGETVQSGGAGGTGIGIYKSALYVESNDKIVRYMLPAGSIVPKDPPQTIVSGLPLGGDHPMHPFAIDAKGSMYVDVGTATNSCQPQNRTLESAGLSPCTELETRGGIWRYDANKTNQTFSPAERFATGIRNGEGFAIDSTGRMFVTQHGRDQLYSNWPAFYQLSQEATLPAEELLSLRQGGDYGWPECYYDPALRTLVLAPEYGGNGKRVGQCASKIGPIAYFPAHWAPDGMVLYDKQQFPARYRNGVFIAFHGSWNRAPYAQKGYNVVFQALAGDEASGKCEIFADGFAGTEKSPDKAAHRPTGLAVGPDGSLYVSDDVRGRIYRIAYRGGAEAGAIHPVACPSASAPAGAIVAVDANPPEGNHANAGVPDTANLPIPEGSTKEMVALGDRIFHGRVGGATCTGCHGSNATGTPLGPNLINNRWFWSDGSYSGIAATIRVGVMHPKNYRAPMPAMGGAHLTADQVSAVAAYVWALSQPATDASSARAAPAELAIPGEKIYPESITAAADGRVFIGSIVQRDIFLVKPGASTAEVWISADNETTLGVYGLFADDRSNTLWACFSSFPGSQGSPQAPSALNAYDLHTGKLKTRYPLPSGGAFCNDIAIGPDGTAYVTDSDNMEIDRLPGGGGRLQVWAGKGGFGPKGGVLDGISLISNRIVVNVHEQDFRRADRRRRTSGRDHRCYAQPAHRSARWHEGFWKDQCIAGGKRGSGPTRPAGYQGGLGGPHNSQGRVS